MNEEEPIQEKPPLGVLEAPPTTETHFDDLEGRDTMLGLKIFIIFATGFLVGKL
jgi:hypothetical protein